MTTERTTDVRSAAGRPGGAGPTPGEIVAKQPDHLRSVAKGGGLNFIGAIVYGASNFILLWVLNRALGTRDAGVVLVAIAAFNVVSKTAELGCSTGLIRWISRSRAEDNHRDVAALGRIALVPVAVVSVVSAGLMWFGASTIASWFASKDDADQFVSVLRAMAPFLPAASLHSVIVQATRGYNTMLPQTLIEKVGRALALPLIVAVVHSLGMSTAGVGGAWAASSLVALIASGWALLRLMRRDRIVAVPSTGQIRGRTEPRSGGSPGLPGAFWRFTGARAVGQTFEVAVNWIDTLMVAGILSTTQAGIYASGTRYVLLGTFTSDAVMQVCGPKVSSLLARNDRIEANQVVRYATGWQVMVTWPIYLLVIGFAEPLLGIFGSAVLDARGALTLLALGLIVQSLAGPAATVMLMAGRSRTALINTATAVVFNFVGNLWAIPRFGITGAGGVWALTLIIAGWMPAIQAHRSLKTTTFGRPCLVAAGSSVVSVGAAAAVSRWWFGPTWPGLLVAATAGGAAYLVLLWKMNDELALSALVPRRR